MLIFQLKLSDFLIVQKEVEMRSSQKLWRAFLAWFVTAPVIGIFFEQSLLSDDAWADWYEKNDAYKFGVGDTIYPGLTPGTGYGTDPEGLVTEHRDGKYVVMMTTSRQNDDGTWTRQTAQEVHFKWNIEHHFRRRRTYRKIPVATAVA